MKLNQPSSYILVAFLGIAVIILIVMGSLQTLQAQTPSSTPTRIPLIGQSTVTPLFVGDTPVPTLPSNLRLPTEKPLPTQYNGPTVTPSGPLVAVDITRPLHGETMWEVDNGLVARIYAALPNTVGSLRIAKVERTTFFNRFEIGIGTSTDAHPGEVYYAEIAFFGNAYDAYAGYIITANGMTKSGRAVVIGDAAYIAPQDIYVAVMQYRNVLISVNSPYAERNLPVPYLLTEQQLTELLEAILKVLQQASPATAVATP